MANRVTLPSNVEAERYVLGSALIDPDAVSIVVVSLFEKQFSNVDHRNILVFRAMKEVYDRGDPVEIQTVTAQMNNTNTLDEAGGVPYLMELVQSVVDPDNVEHYISIVQNTYNLKQYLLTIKQIQDDYAEGNFEDMMDFITASTQKLSEISMKRSTAGFLPAGDISEAVQKKIESEKHRGNKILTGVDTGFKKLNEYTHGWQNGDLIILAARPSVGKTAFALNLCLNATRQNDQAVALFSCEMSSDLVMRRILSAVSKVENNKINTADITDPRDIARFKNAVNEMKSVKLYIDDTPRIKLGELVAKTRKLKNDHPELSLVVIDYLGLIQTEQKMESTAKEIGLVTATLKELARTLNIPVIALAQLNRDVEKQDGHVPMLSHLKDSGSIEQDADIVMLMYRADYYKDLGHSDTSEGKPGSFENRLNQEVEKNKDGNRHDISTVTINVAKNRNGQIGKVVLLFSKAYSLFDNPSEEFEKQHLKNQD